MGTKRQPFFILFFVARRRKLPIILNETRLFIHRPPTSLKTIGNNHGWPVGSGFCSAWCCFSFGPYVHRNRRVDIRPCRSLHTTEFMEASHRRPSPSQDAHVALRWRRLPRGRFHFGHRHHWLTNIVLHCTVAVPRSFYSWFLHNGIKGILWHRLCYWERCIPAPLLIRCSPSARSCDWCSPCIYFAEKRGSSCTQPLHHQELPERLEKMLVPPNLFNVEMAISTRHKLMIHDCTRMNSCSS